MSKIIDDLSSNIIFAGPFIDKTELALVLRPQELRDLIAHARALEAMLRKHEWGYNGESFTCLDGCCDSNTKNHSPDCELAKLLDGTEPQIKSWKAPVLRSDGYWDTITYPTKAELDAFLEGYKLAQKHELERRL